MQLQIPCWNNSTDVVLTIFSTTTLQLMEVYSYIKTHHWIMSSYIGQPRRRGRQYSWSTSFISCKIKSGRQIFCVCWVSWCTQFQTHNNITKPCPATVMFLAARSLCTKDLPARYCIPEATSLQNTRRVWEVSDGTISSGLLGNGKECLLYTQ